MRYMFKKCFFFILLVFILLVCAACSGECTHRNMSRNVVSPSCGSRGYTVFVCNDCSFSFESDYVAPSPHTLTKTQVLSTCTSGGYTLNECSVCDYSYISDLLPKRDHSIVTVKISPTCTSSGYTLRQCTECTYENDLDLTDPIPHDFEINKVAPTCKNEGYTEYSCKNCDLNYIADQISALAHTFTSTVTPPTCLDQGYTKKLCSICAENIITDYTQPTGHSYTDTTVRATSSRDGYTLRQCKNCNYSYQTDYVYSYSVFMGAYTASNKVLAKGVDVSSYNGELNWKSIAAAGFDFAIIRAGSSLSGKDPYFEANYNGARAAGLDIGAYFYSEDTTLGDILDSAKELKDILTGKKFEYPIYLDIEKDQIGQFLGKDLLTNMSVAFMENLQSDGFYTALYTNNNWLENFYHKDQLVGKYDVWYARYLSEEDLVFPEWKLEKYGAAMGIWQYTKDGVIEGFDHPFDFNFSYRDYPAIIKRFHYNGY